MRICATIAEFNPYHNGHRHLIDSFSEDYDAHIAVMSGNFVQRGSPAIYDKFSRAQAALENGFDLIIELPVIYSLSSAQNFAAGAVKILNSTNVVHSLIFGSESGSISDLTGAAVKSLSETDSFKFVLKQELAKGLSYPKALSLAWQKTGIDPTVMSSPNNILAIEYIKALINTNSSILPLTIKRYGAQHDSSLANQSYASASHIRQLISSGLAAIDFMPPYPYSMPVIESDFSGIVNYTLRSSSINDFTSVCDCPAELASRFKKASVHTSIEQIISAVKSKNFTESRIRRTLWNIVIKNTISPKENPSYIRILAQNKKGSEIISLMKQKASLPIIQKASSLKSDPVFAVESRATDIYNIPRNLPSGEDFRYSPKQIL